jgi:hypothetical protein
MGGKILQHIGAGIAARRQLLGALGMLGANIQNIQGIARVEARLGDCDWRGFLTHIPFRSAPGIIVTPAL